MINSLAAKQEMWIQALDQEDSQEKEMSTHSSILAWKIPWTGKHGWLQSMGGKESDTAEHVRTCSVII